MKRLRMLAIASTLVLVVAACGRDSESTNGDNGAVASAARRPQPTAKGSTPAPSATSACCASGAPDGETLKAGDRSRA